MTRVRTWKVLEWGKVPEDTVQTVEYTCTKCWREAEMPVVGLPIAQIGQGIVFDTGGAMPARIQCRGCRAAFELCAPHGPA